jgi:hypothetical protein
MNEKRWPTLPTSGNNRHIGSNEVYSVFSSTFSDRLKKAPIGPIQSCSIQDGSDNDVPILIPLNHIKPPLFPINSHENLIFPASITEFEGKTLPLPLKALAGLEAACGLRYMGHKWCSYPLVGRSSKMRIT